MRRASLTPALYAVIADRFKLLAEPARLMILDAMRRGGEMTVTELVERTGLAQANVSKHLRLLYAHGFVKRRKNSQFVHYSAGDPAVHKLCDAMCAHLEQDTKARRRLTARA
jgi:DNA-binding transcriptional ArsR family regulator